MSPARRRLPHLVSGLVVAVAVLAFGAVGAARYQALKAETAQALAGPTPPPAPVFVDESSVAQLPRLAFAWDGPEALAAFRTAEALDAVVAGAETDEERVRRLASWTRAQFPPGTPEPFPAPDAATTLGAIRRGETGGGPAQYSFVLVQSLQAMGIPARIVTLRLHVGVEAWLADQARWTFVDPTYECQVLDADGRSLDAVDCRTQVRCKLPLRLSDGHRYEGSPSEYFEVFDDVGVWLRNAFVRSPMNAADFDRYCVWFEERVGVKARPANSLRTSFREDLYGAPIFP